LDTREIQGFRYESCPYLNPSIFAPYISSIFIEPGPQFAVPQFGVNSYYNENSVQKTDLVFKSNNDV